MKIDNSISLFNEAKKYIPGGVNSPVRAFKSVGGNPVFIKNGSGPRVTDADGNQYIDYIGSWGPHIFGHNPDFIKLAVAEALEHGTSFGAPTAIEISMAKAVCDIVPGIEQVRMVNSGTEATMSAIRLARGYTRRDKIIKFEGCYHGHGDSFLIKAGSGALTFGEPTSPGVTRGTAADTLVAQFNDMDSVNELVKQNPDNIAGIIVEPIAGNMGVVPGSPEFLHGLRDLCDRENIVLIFDEVMSGFRVSRGGAQEIYGINADLVTFGKVIGGGLPVGAFGGRKEIMEKVSPLGPIYQAGTLSGNPLAMAAGYASLKYILDNPEMYDELEAKGEYLENGMRKNLNELGLDYAMNRVGSMSCMFFAPGPVDCFAKVMASDTEKYARYFHGMLDRGIYLAPAQFEAMFVSLSHSYEDLDDTIAAHLDVLSEMQN